LPTTLGSRKVAYTTPNNIIVEEAGLYDITYSMNPGFNAAATLILAVRSNEVPIQSAVATIVETGTDPYSINFAGNTIATLATGAIVDMSVTSNVAQTINFEANSLEYLNVLKLD